MTLHLPQVFSPEGLGRCLRLLGSECCGQVLRAKGIVETETGFLNVQFLPGSIVLKRQTSRSTSCV